MHLCRKFPAWISQRSVFQELIARLTNRKQVNSCFETIQKEWNYKKVYFLPIKNSFFLEKKPSLSLHIVHLDIFKSSMDKKTAGHHRHISALQFFSKLPFRKALFWKKKRFLQSNCHFFQIVMSHVVGVMEVYYLPSYAGSTLGQHCCMVATVNIYKSQ